MFRWLIRRQLRAFERKFQYDTSYLQEILEADPHAAILFSKAASLGKYRGSLPRDAWYAAGLVGIVSEDCGPCTQLAVKMAEQEGMSPAVIRAVLEHDLASMPDDVALAFRFAHAAVDRRPEVEPLREQVVARWGPRAAIAVAYALAASRIYPTVKYTLGHGQACIRVQVGGSTVHVAHEQVA
jgi:hypothetical protein